MQNEQKNIIIDCDPGVDDAVALLYAFKSSGFNIELISTVSGNVDVEKTTINAVGIRNLAGASVDIVQGSEVPLISQPVFAADVHGESGLGTYEFKDIDLREYQKEDVVTALYERIMNSEKKIHLVAIGPFTNIARLFFLYPEVKENIENISIMGGGLKGGNYDSAAEFNVVVDPEAAHVLFNSGVPIIMAGLDVTEKALLSMENLDIIARIPNVGPFIEKVVKSSPRSKTEEGMIQLNDVVSLMYLTNPEIFKTEEVYVDVELEGYLTRGFTLGDRRRVNPQKPNTKVIMDLDHDKFIDLLMKELIKYE